MGILRIQKQTTAYVEMNLLVSDILYTDTQAVRFFGARSVYSAATAIAIYMGGTDIDSYDLHQTLLTLQEPGFIFTGSYGNDPAGAKMPEEAFFYYAYPIYPRTERRRSILFIIPANRMIAKLIPSIDSQDTAFYILNRKNGESVGTSTDKTRLRETAVSLAGGETAPGLMKLQGKQYYGSTAVSEDGQWSFAMVQAVSAYRRNLLWSFAPVLISMLILLTMEAFFLRLFLKWNYSPMADLVVEILSPHQDEAASPRGTLEPSVEELGTARRAVHTLRQDYDRYKSLQKLFFLLINPPSAAETGSLDKLLRALGLDDRSIRFLPVAVRYEALEAPPDRESLRLAVLQRLEPLPGCELVDRLEVPGLFILLWTRSEELVPQTEKTLEELKSLLDGSSNRACALSAPGQWCGGSGLYSSVGVSLQAEATSLSWGDGGIRIAPYRDSASPRPLFPWQELSRLESYLEQGETGSAGAILARMEKQILAGDFQAPMASALASATEFLIGKHRKNLRIDQVDGSPWARMHAQSRSLIPDGSAHGAQDRYRTMPRAEKLREYVEAHWQEANFGLQAVAACLGISPAAASAAFSTHFGISLVEYMTKHRIDLAKTLLSEGVPVKDVVTKIGYSDPTSFIRKFKRINGLTPKEWAQQSKSNISNSVKT
jgi:AraC-like DNA-binding protein